MTWAGRRETSDRAQMARFAAYLYGAGAVLVLATLLLPRSANARPLGIAGPAVIAIVVSAALLRRGALLPLWVYDLIPALGSLLVSVVAYSGDTAAPAYGFLYVWATLYAFYFLPRRIASLHMAFVLVNYAVVLALVHSTQAHVQWVMAIGTVLVASVWVDALVRRLRSHGRELQALAGRLEELAGSDGLTGLKNRREWERILAATTPRSRFAMLAVDIDKLKPVNDEFGHEAGDMVLRAVGSALAAVLRGWDVVARVGGDEFAALLVGATVDEARIAGERVRTALHGVAVPLGQARISIGCAAGVAGTDPLSVWTAADNALGSAKRKGRDRVEIATDEDRWSDGREWTELIPVLLQRRAVHAVFQPIVRLHDRGLVGYEALARTPRAAPDSGVDAMFLAAHRIGAMRDLDWLCRRTAVQQAADLPAGLLLFLNVSIGSLLDPVHDVDQMLLLLRWAGRSPQDIVLEITERETIGDLDRLCFVLAAYREHGFRFALDDVGEGHSTLEVLARATPDYVKLAGSLVGACEERGSRAAIAAAVAFARSSGAVVIAEGIENEHTARRMADLGVELGQGWRLGRPAEASQLRRTAARGLSQPA